MTTEEIKKLPIKQKIQMMEVLWEDLRERFDRFAISEQHKKVLDERRGPSQDRPGSASGLGFCEGIDRAIMTKVRISEETNGRKHSKHAEW